MLGYPHSLSFCSSSMSAQPREDKWLCLPSFLLLEGALGWLHGRFLLQSPWPLVG